MITLPAAWIAKALAPQANDVLLAFLTITHPDITTTYLVNDTVNQTRLGQVYTALGSLLILPPEQNGNQGIASLDIDAVDLSTITNLRTASPINGPLMVNIVLALASAPDDGVSFGTFQWKPLAYTDLHASGQLVDEDPMDIMMPGDTLSPVNNPGAF